MSKVGAFLAGFVVAAAAAGGAWWIVLAPKAREDGDRVQAAERASLRAKRDASDRAGEADSERRRRLELEEQVVELKRTLTAAPPPRAAAPMAGSHTPKPGGDIAPEMWDNTRLTQEIATLATAPRPFSGSPRFPLVVRALKAHLDSGTTLLSGVMRSQLDNDTKSLCATLLGALGDPRGTRPMLDAWASATDPDLRQALLQGLGNLPGADATPIFVGVWNDPAADAKSRLLAIHGLARRRHPIALAVAEGGAPGATPPLRLQALQTLHAQALGGEWKDTELVSTFGKALLSADGDPQRKLALTALEGFWSKDSLADLDAFIASPVSSDLATRARRSADAIRAGAPRPAGAGVAPQRPVAPTDTEPAEEAPPAPAPKDVPKDASK